MPAAYRGLTTGERRSLLHGISFTGEEGFQSPEEYEAAWWRYRETLIFELGAFRRPDAFWWIEVGYVPDCPAHGYESERAALIRLGLMLSPQEAAEARCTRAQTDGLD